MSATRLLVAVGAAAVVAAGNYAVLQQLAPGTTCMPCLAWLLAGPLVMGLLLAAALPTGAAAAPAVVAPAPPPPPPPTDAALRLLGALQEEGRLVDFLQEDLSPYSDEQIGAAVRGIHEGCKKALGERVGVEPVLRGAEGETVTVEPGFDPAAIRLTGNVTGAPPFRGVLRHGGWRAVSVKIPERAGQDPHVLAPAEVELA